MLKSNFPSYQNVTMLKQAFIDESKGNLILLQSDMLEIEQQDVRVLLIDYC